MLVYTYKCIISWEGYLSSPFQILRGVIQGICSCWLFNVCLHDLVVAFENSKLGCLLGYIFVGCIFDADVILLMSGFVIKLHLMLGLCTECATDYDLLSMEKSHVV